MIKKIQDRFVMGEDSAKNLIKGALWSAMQNISLFLPAMYAFYFIRERLNLNGTDAQEWLGLTTYLLIALFSFIIMFLIARKQYNSVYTVTYEESASKRINLAEKLRKLPLSFFGKKDIADLSATIMEDVAEFETVFSHAVPQIIGSVISTSVIALLLFFFDYKMAIAVYWVVPLAFIVFSLAKKKIAKGNRELYNKKRKILAQVQESLDCVQEIKSYNYEEQYSDMLDDTINEYEDMLIKNEGVASAFLNLSSSILNLGLITVTIIGAYLYTRGESDVFTYLVFMIVSASVYLPFLSSLNHMAALLYLDVRLDRFREMQALPIQEGQSEINPNGYDIVFKDVVFSYESDLQTVNGVSFNAKQGEITALVGPSGGGKSTLTKLAARFWDIDSGLITVGGEDISKVEPETLLKLYSIVFQNVTLFNNTIMENIRMGKKDATDEEVKLAAKNAQCLDFINKLPEGYDTMIGENGTKLSGGERQRISIARAMLKDAPIILLDEATASLDAMNETKVQKALSTLIKDKTVLLIAHRMRTVANADKIIVIKEGKILEMGSPDELQSKESYFKMMNEARENLN